MAAEVAANPDVIFAVFNAGGEQRLILPDTVPVWRLVLDTTRPLAEEATAEPGLTVPANCVLVFTPDPAGAPK